MAAALDQVIALLELLLPEIAGHHRSGMGIHAIGEVLAGQTDPGSLMQTSRNTQPNCEQPCTAHNKAVVTASRQRSQSRVLPQASEKPVMSQAFRSGAALHQSKTQLKTTVEQALPTHRKARFKTRAIGCRSSPENGPLSCELIHDSCLKHSSNASEKKCFT